MIENDHCLKVSHRQKNFNYWGDSDRPENGEEDDEESDDDDESDDEDDDCDAPRGDEFPAVLAL